MGWVFFKNGEPVGASCSNGRLRVMATAVRRYGRDGLDLKLKSQCTESEINTALAADEKNGYGQWIKRGMCKW